MIDSLGGDPIAYRSRNAERDVPCGSTWFNMLPPDLVFGVKKAMLEREGDSVSSGVDRLAVNPMD